MSGKMNAMVVVATVLLLCMSMAACLSYHGADDENSSAMPSGMGSMPEPDAAEGDLCEFVPMDEQSQTTPMDGGMMPAMDGHNQSQVPTFPTTEDGERPSMPAMDNSQMPGAETQGTVTSATSATEVVTSTVVNTAKDLAVDMDNATVIVMSDENNEVTISESGTYVVTGTCSDGNIVVKKGTTGVVLVLKDLDLTSTTGAPVSLNKNTEVKLVVEGTVKLTDVGDPADEDSTDEEVADAFDGAAL